MKTKATCPIIMILCLVTALSASPFVPLEWQTLVKSGPFAGQRKHAGWICDQNGDFIDDAFDELSRDETTQVIVQLSECLCPEDSNAVFGTYGTVISTGVLVAYVILDDVPVYMLDDLAREPFVAGIEKPGEGRLDLDVSTRTLRARASNFYKGEFFADLGLVNKEQIIIAIVDSGVDNSHDALSGKFVAGFNALNWSDKDHSGIDDSCEGLDTGTCEPGDGTTDPDDTVGHGTHVAGIAMGLGVGDSSKGRIPSNPYSEDLAKINCEGMAPGAKLLDVKVSDLKKIEYDTLVYALEWLFRNGKAHVVNISGGTGAMYNSDGTDSISQLINGLVANGMHVAVSAGNDGENRFKSTAASELAVTVANVEDESSLKWDDDKIRNTSNYGPRTGFDLKNLTIGMLKPDVAAPGTSIYSAKYNTKNEYDSSTGTSQATPHVAGAMALLLGVWPDIPPGAMKELLKRTAHYPKHIKPSYPTSIPIYNVKWGYGMIDVYKAAKSLQNGITDISFTAAVKKHPKYPDVRRCLISGGRKSYENDTDILIKDKGGNKEIEPIQDQGCTIEIHVENRGSLPADNVVVCVGVKEIGVGVQEFYKIGCKEIGSIPAKGQIGDKTTVSFNWKPRVSKKPGVKTHDCIQAMINYPFDTQFWNNLTQRNVEPVWINSPAQATFRVENPLNEPAMIILEVKPDATGQKAYTYELEQDTFYLRPEDCPVLNTITFFPKASQPVGQTATFDIAGTAFSESNEDGIELSGVVFRVIAVDPGLERAYTSASHGSEGMIDLPLAFSGSPTSDPRRQVNLVKVFFNVPVRPVSGLSLHEAVRYGVRSDSNNLIPDFNASFEEQADSGTDLTIEFFEPLANEDIYTFNFGHPEGFVDLDGDALTGDGDFELHVLQGDADGSGSLNVADISFVHDRIGQTVEFGSTCRADVNQDGVIKNDDIQFIIDRLPDIVQFDDFARLSEQWLKGDMELVGDLDGDHDLDLEDLLQFASDWLDYIPANWPFELILVAAEK